MRNRSENQITLVIIRHGETKSNREHRYLGKTDELLSEEGKEELTEQGKLGAYPSVDILFTSPMKRCIQTADILYPGVSAVPVEEWTEMDFGAFEGKNYFELRGDERYQTWIDSNGMLPFPGGESREDFILRCEKGFCRIQREVAKREGKEEIERIGLVVHGGTIMALMSRYRGGEYFDYQVGNGRGYICMVKDFEGKPEITEVKKI